MHKAMKSLRSFDSDDEDEGAGEGKRGHRRDNSSYSLRSGDAGVTPTSNRGLTSSRSVRRSNTRGSMSSQMSLSSPKQNVGGGFGTPLGSARRTAKVTRKTSAVTAFSPANLFSSSQRELMRTGVRSHDIITCANCGATDVKTPIKPGGKAEKFVVFANVTQCRNCDHEWIQPVHYITDVDILDPMKVRRKRSRGGGESHSQR